MQCARTGYNNSLLSSIVCPSLSIDSKFGNMQPENTRSEITSRIYDYAPRITVSTWFLVSGFNSWCMCVCMTYTDINLKKATSLHTATTGSIPTYHSTIDSRTLTTVLAPDAKQAL